MPVDHRRVNGPESSTPYQFYTLSYNTTYEKVYKELFSGNGLRSDGRKFDEHRKIYLKTGVVSQAKGSAYIEQQNTKVIVSVFDPREIPNKTDYSVNGELYCEFKYAPFSCDKRRMHQQDAEEKQFSVIMRRALESVVCRHEFPNFQVDIYALVLQNDGSALSAAITCAGVALAHAGVPMYDLITSVNVGIQGEDVFLDPNYREELMCASAVRSGLNDYADHGIVLLAMLATHEQISELYQTGSMKMECLTKCVDMLMNANKKVVPLTEKCLVKFVMKHIKEN